MRGATDNPQNVSSSCKYFNPRAPCGARHYTAFTIARKKDFNPRAPCGARHLFTACLVVPIIFQSTRPMRGATIPFSMGFVNFFEFQSTRPMRGATKFTQKDEPNCVISIHAPHAGRDFQIQAFSYLHYHFNPRAPCGARHKLSPSCSISIYFNPRAPCGARHVGLCLCSPDQQISIHAPHAGRDYAP